MDHTRSTWYKPTMYAVDMLKIFQRCSNAVGWTVVEVESESNPGTMYRVVISDWDYLCDCKGFEFNGKCKHRAMAEALRCRWEEGNAPCQSNVERQSHICPTCGSPTIIVVERDE